MRVETEGKIQTVRLQSTFNKHSIESLGHSSTRHDGMSNISKFGGLINCQGLCFVPKKKLASISFSN